MTDEHKCHICATTFKTDGELDDHLRAMHSEYTCDACGQVFTSKSDLESHNQEAHPERVGTPAR